MSLNLETPAAQSGWTDVLQPWKKLNDSAAFEAFASVATLPIFPRGFIPKLSEYITRGLSAVGRCVLTSVSLGRGAAQNQDTKKILAALNAIKGRQITTQFERDAEREAQRTMVGLGWDKVTDAMMEPAVSNTTFGWPKYCIFCMPQSQQGAYQRT